MQLFNTYNGYKVVIVSPVKAQSVTHTRKRWMTSTYHFRINKKWLKRYGYMLVNPMPRDSISVIGDTIFATPEQANILKKHSNNFVEAKENK